MNKNCSRTSRYSFFILGGGEMKRPIVLIAVILAMFVSAVEATIVTTAMPSIAASFGSFSRYSWVFSSYLLMSTVSVLIYGKLADVYGRKTIFNIGMTIFLIGSLLAGFATTFEQLTMYRLIQGLGAGALSPIASTIVGDIYTMEERAKIQGYLSSVWGISAVLGPALGGLLVQYFSWHYVFWVNVPLGILAMLGITLFLKEEVKPKRVAIDYQGALLSTLVLSLFILWIVEGGQSFERFSFIGSLMLVLAILFLCLFIRIEKRAIDPIVPMNIWRNPLILYANIVSLLTGIILMAISSYLPTYVTGLMGEHALIAGFTLTAMSIGWPIASTISGHLLVRYGPFTTSLTGGISLTVGAGLFVTMTPTSGPIWAGFGSFWIGVGMGLTSTAFLVAIQNSVPYALRGSATASNMFMRNFGNTMGAALFGAVLNRSIMHYFQKLGSEGTIDEMNVLLTHESRKTLDDTTLRLLQNVLEQAMFVVFMGVLIIVIICFYFIFKIPRGKVVAHDSE